MNNPNLDPLITDRTSQDVATRTQKGFYNVSDVTRVNSYIEYLSDVLDLNLTVKNFSLGQILTRISIHAPARGATAVLSKKINDFQISRSFFFCGAVQAAHWARKPTLKPHIRRTLAKRPVQQTADPALSRPKMRDLRPDFGANPSAIL